MKIIKKLATLMLSLCLFVSCFTLPVLAADGEIVFNDPSAEIGEEVLIRVRTKVDAGISNLKFTVSYDPQYLQYVSATNVTKTEDGTLEYEYHMNVNSLNEGYDVYIKFVALKDGVTEVNIASNNIETSYDVAWVHGKAVVTIGTGEGVQEPTEETPSEDEPVTDETVEDEPAEDEKPSEDTSAEETPSNDETDVNESPEETTGKVVISNVTTITLMQDVAGIELPEQYKEATVTMDGVEYPAWRNTANADMYVLYAVSDTTGIPSLYQYDTLENTYQRFEAPEMLEAEDNTEAATEDMLAAIFGEYTNYVYIGAAALILILLILVIVFGIKLVNRNSELDEVYDDLDELLAAKETDKNNAEPVVETQDDIVFTPEDAEGGIETTEESEEDDSEVEVEFYIEESIKEFFAEEEKIQEQSETENEISELPVMEEPEVTVEKPSEKEEFYDDEDSFYDDLESHFSVNFIDLDD